MEPTFHDSHTEESLWHDINNGTEYQKRYAREQIILSYQFLVEAAARKLKASFPSYIMEEDLMSYGQIGLIRAVDSFEPDRGIFRSFAYLKIYGAIMDELRTQDWAPRGLRRDQRIINQAIKELQKENPSLAEIGSKIGWEEDKVAAVLKKVDNTQHRTLEGIENQIGDSDPEQEVNTAELCRIFAEALQDLPVEHQIIIARRYILGQTLPVVSEHINMSLVTVRKNHSEAVAHIHKSVRSAVSMS